MQNSSDICKKINKKLCFAALPYVGVICAACIGWSYLYRYLLSNQIALRWFIIFMLLGAVILESVVGLLQLWKTRAGDYFFSVSACIAIALLWAFYVIVCIVRGIRPQKNTDVILGIFFSILLANVTLVLAFILYCRVDVLADLYRCSRELDRHLKIYGESAMQYNRSVSIYNGMNQKINNIASVIGKKQGKQKYIEGLNESMDIPLLDVSAIGIFVSQKQLHAYMRDVHNLCTYIEEILQEVKKQMFYIDSQVGKKSDLVNQAGRTVEKIQNKAVFTEENRRNMLLDVQGSYKSLIKRNRLERKIKGIKKGRKNG